MAKHQKGIGAISAFLFLILAIVFFSISYVAPSDIRPYLIGASCLPFGLIIVGIIKG